MTVGQGTHQRKTVVAIIVTDLSLSNQNGCSIACLYKIDIHIIFYE